ncbi:response regulator transcription factor [Sphingomonas azotifigens]|uniref:response regulator transcription factor n=1 Tax=Sphingomonas azotifigens TaxID=330920 RepID=UPI000A035FC0|nr:response regulator transcription factor [Sphingomonas azotifigens]
MRILLVEDDAEIGDRLREGLGALGFVIELVRDGETALDFGRQEGFDAIILDLGLPQLPGIEVLRRWRADGCGTPVLILTARSSWTEKVEGLNAGADDYVGKPFHVDEIAARLRALMRRAAGYQAAVLRHGTIVLDPASGLVTVAGAPVELTAREFRLLTFLLHRVGRIVTHAELLDHLYGLEEEPSSNTIEVFIGRLRRKIGRDSIRTLRGLGYRFDAC